MFPGNVSRTIRLGFLLSCIADILNQGHQTDRKGALGKLPSLFETLVEGGEEPKVAVRKVVALLAGDE